MTFGYTEASNLRQLSSLLLASMLVSVAGFKGTVLVHCKGALEGLGGIESLEKSTLYQASKVHFV